MKKQRMRRVFRCAGCGTLLPVLKDQEANCRRVGCQKAGKVEWTPTMAAAYRAQVERFEAGEPFEVRDGLLGNTYKVAAMYVERWWVRAAGV